MLLGGAFLLGQEFPARTSTATTLAPPPPTNSVPVLREVFTLLPCDQLTTIGLEGCAEHQSHRLDAGINTLRRQLYATLRTSAARGYFVAAEVAWTTYRSSLCQSEASVYQGGSLAPVAYARCLVRNDQRHLTALRDAAARVTHP